METTDPTERKVNDKNQLVFTFNNANSFLPTEEQSYADGWHSGVVWKWDHFPGGPFVCNDRFSPNPEWTAYCDQTRLNNKAYLRGWFDGIIAGAENNENPWVKQNLRNIVERQKAHNRNGIHAA